MSAAVLAGALMALLGSIGLTAWWVLPTGRGCEALARQRAADRVPVRVDGPDEHPVSAGVLLELVASMLEAGIPVSRALRVLGASLQGPSGRGLGVVATALELGLSWKQAWAAAGPVPASVEDLRAALTFSAVSGAPSAAALRAASAQVRRAEHRRAEAAAERLSVHLMVPLGLCSLPAFICWGILPVLIGLVPDLLE